MEINAPLKRMLGYKGSSRISAMQLSKKCQKKILQVFFNDSSSNNGAIYANNCTFNPLDKLVEAFEENKQLYERLVQAEKEKVAYLEELLRGKK